MATWRCLTKRLPLSQRPSASTLNPLKSFSPNLIIRVSSTKSRTPEETLYQETQSPPQVPTPSPHFTNAPTTAHSDLASYVAYATRTGLSPKSTTYVGTHYEYMVAASLRRLGFDLRRIGGRSDGGIDLLGTWTVPSLGPSTAGMRTDKENSSSSSSSRDERNTATLRIILQCKAYTAKAGPQHIRELEGAFIAAPPGWRTTGSSSSTGGVVGVLVAQKPATKGVRDALGRSRWPMAYIACSKDGRVEQLLWNRRSEEEGLEGMGVAVQHRDSEEAGGEHVEELVLTWQGLPYLASDIDAVKGAS
ncbi:uncharacterized protein B0I36DRAFT_323685 [Microdochium trichocladiopsis]|uniref:Required for respiratory growth protein 7, mitochondrial n=1 Tax=Microdochium trichocladiopsis TaxID=1682393 RepID=A0A9P9BNJ6_9PEZI|nr:uncharacterized protein B0I36DRAFT_323685 [Microdochium trichocladiopsis]KAH7031321.1 hypothetical protein B0I36DRAFT_323685 [Microdochium trichocladiopsis]